MVIHKNVTSFLPPSNTLSYQILEKAFFVPFLTVFVALRQHSQNNNNSRDYSSRDSGFGIRVSGTIQNKSIRRECMHMHGKISKNDEISVNVMLC